MLFYYLKRDFNFKFIFAVQFVLVLTIVFMNIVFSNYDEDYRDANRIKIGIVNYDVSDMKSGLLIENFKSNEQFSQLFEIVESEQEDVKEMFYNGEIDCYVEIPQGFSDGLMHYENQNIHLFVDAKNPTKNMILSNVFHAYSNFIKGSNLATYSLYNLMEEAALPREKLESINNAFSVEMVGTALDRARFFEIKRSSQLPLVDALRYFLYALPLAFLSFLSIHHGMDYLKSRRALIVRREILILNSEFKFLYYDVISRVIGTFCIFLPLFALQFAFYGMGNSLLSAFILFLAILFFTMLWRILSFLLPSEFGLSMLGSFLAFVMSLLSGCIVPFLILPQALKTIGERMPHFWFLKLFMPIENMSSAHLINGIFMILTIIILEFILEYLLLKRELI